MEVAPAIHPCLFRWEIASPFVPWRRMQATFYHKLPELSSWLVTLEPCHFSTNFWCFQVILRGEEVGEPSGLILTSRIDVTVSINDQLMTQSVKENYDFSVRNRHKCVFESLAHTAPLLNRPHSLVIDIEIHFPRLRIFSQDNGLMNDDRGVTVLSNAMEALLYNPSHYDLILESENRTAIFHVHSYVIQARWWGFFKQHDRIVGNTVDTNISAGVLFNILHYIYTGRFYTSAPDLDTPENMTELYRVMDRYQLQHLHEVFASDVVRQLRTTKRDLSIHREYFRLDDNSGRALDSPSYLWIVDGGENYGGIIFRITFILRERRPCFHYSLQLTSPVRIYVQVNLEFIRKFRGNRYMSVRTTHQRDYLLEFEDEVMSGTCRFEGNNEDLHAFINGTRRYRRGTIVRHLIRCILYISKGESVTEIESEDRTATPMGIERRQNLLSDHMYRLFLEPLRPDFHILCPTQLPPAPDKGPLAFHLHKSIFEVRVPEWRALLRNYLDGNGNYPQFVSFSSIISRAFHEILVYIYTGKVNPAILGFLDEVQNFAVQGGMEDFRNYIDDLRLAQENL